MRLTITDSEGTIILVINLDEYELEKPLAAASLMNDIRDAVARAMLLAKRREAGR